MYYVSALKFPVAIVKEVLCMQELLGCPGLVSLQGRT